MRANLVASSVEYSAIETPAASKAVSISRSNRSVGVSVHGSTWGSRTNGEFFSQDGNVACMCKASLRGDT